MKKLSFMMTLLVAVLLLASCGKKDSALLVPEDAFVVMRFDMAQTTEKAGLKDSDADWKKKLKKEIKNMDDLDEEMRDRILAIIDDPTKSGIDFTEPMYAFVTGDPTRGNIGGGLVGTIASKSDLTELLNAISEMSGEEVEESNGVNYMVSDGAGIIFNGDWFYAGPVKDVDDTIDALLERIDGKGSLDGHKAFEQMCEKKGVMQMLMLYEPLAEMREFKDVANMMPEGAELKDLAALADLELNDGEAVLTSEAVALSDEWEEYIEKGDKTMNDIEEDQAKYISDNCLSMLVNIEAKDYLKMMEPMLKNLGIGSDELQQVKDIVGELDGTAALDFSGLDGNSKPIITAYVGTKNGDTVKQLIAEVGDSLISDGDNQYLIPITEYDWWTETYNTVGYYAAGFKNGQSYFATDKDNLFTTPSKKIPSGDIKGKGIYARFNFDFLNTLAEDMSRSDRMIMDVITKVFDHAELYYEGDAKAVFRVTTKNKKKNPIECIIDAVKDFM